MMQRDNIKIRKTELNDIPLIAEMEKRCFSVCAWTENMFMNVFSDSNNENIMLSAYYGETLAGYIVMGICLDEAELMVIAVDEAFRNRGIAEILLDTALEMLKGKIKRIFLEVRESNNAARRLYEKKGFQANGMRKNYYRDNSGNPPENAVLMMLNVTR